MIYANTAGERLDILPLIEIENANQLERQMNHEGSKGQKNNRHQ
jgi:hypothetical protein